MSIGIELLTGSNTHLSIALVGQWFLFWGIGVRLLAAGTRQIAKPELTAEGILGIKDKKSWQLVRELGFANLGVGLIGVLSLWLQDWRYAAALTGGLFMTLAGLEHIAKKNRNLEENIALYSDLFIGLIMVIYLISAIS